MLEIPLDGESRRFDRDGFELLINGECRLYPHTADEVRVHYREWGAAFYGAIVETSDGQRLEVHEKDLLQEGCS